MSRRRRAAGLAILVALPALPALSTHSAFSATAAPPPASAATGSPRRASTDLAALAQGRYRGESAAAAGSVIVVDVQRIGPDRVRLTADPPALPAVAVQLRRTTDRLVAADGTTTVMVDLRQQPARLDWSTRGRGAFAGLRQ